MKQVTPEKIVAKTTIAEAAFSYDMPLSEVERIAKLFPNEFYEKLEEYISDRAKR